MTMIHFIKFHHKIFAVTKTFNITSQWQFHTSLSFSLSQFAGSIHKTRHIEALQK